MDSVETEFGENRSLYDVLGVQPTATTAEIKKAYFKVALKCHPDKCPGDAAAKGRFQALSVVHSVLSDPERRSLYDETGEVADEDQDASEEGNSWSDYWRNLFPKITVADITSFSGKYKGSDEEKKDILEAYEKRKGNMSAVIDSIMLATEADEDRMRAVIDVAIQNGEAPAFSAYKKGAKTARSAKSAAKRKTKMDKEAAEAEELMSKLRGRHENKKSEASLSTHRAREFDSMVSALEASYGGGKRGSGSQKGGGKEGKRSKKVSPPDIDDAEFERIQSNLGKGRSKR
eukprot:jgi/Undpi1/8107/HiC_scaffold_24.g10579.m1